jgi:Dolichyl-phosphate-mannose-protein mannosyltransferase
MIADVSIGTTRQDGVAKAVGGLCILSSPVWMYVLFFPFRSDSPVNVDQDRMALALLLLLAAVVHALLIRWLSDGDHFLAQVMLIGFLMKLAGVAASMATVVHVYDSVGDVFYYYGSAARIADKHALTGQWTILQPFWSTNFIIMLTSWLMYVVGKSFQSLMVVFAIFSYWGQYLFYKSFCIGFPKEDGRSAALFMFFLPSVVFWTATIGKDAVVFFCIGLCCYGFVKMSQSSQPSALLIVLVSLGGVMLVRPHVAGMLTISMGVAYLATSTRGGSLGVAVKSLGVPILLITSVYLVNQASTFVDLKDVGGTKHVLEHAAQKNLQVEGTKLGSSLGYRLLAAPFLLFRPFPWEVRNPQMAIAAIEAFALMIFFWRRRSAVLPTLQRCRQDPFFLFSWIYLVEFSFLFAGAMTNFGLLARERDMLIPVAVMTFLSAPRAQKQMWGLPRHELSKWARVRAPQVITS